MIEAEFSRRVAKIMHTPIIEGFTAKERIDFVKAVDKAGNFEKLDKKYQTIIKNAESDT